MKERARQGIATFLLVPAVLVAVGVLAYFTVRTTLQIEKLRQQSVLEATLALAREKADRIDKRIVEQDSAIMAIADPAHVLELTERWLPTAPRETPTIRAILVLDEARNVLSFASRASGALAEDEAFRRLLVVRMLGDMELGGQPLDQLRHLHRVYRGQSYLVSYWQKQQAGGRYLVVAWHDIGRIVKYALPSLTAEPVGGAAPSRVNVVDEEGRIIFGPQLRTGQFTVSVRFPTTLYNWSLQVVPATGEELATRVANRRLLELIMVAFACLVVVAGVMAILFATWKERRISELKSEFVANVSHELKTPLALIRMFGEMLQSGRVANASKHKEYIDIIVAESERLSSLIENVLDFAKVDRGHDAYDFAVGDLGAAVTRAVTTYRHHAEREGVELTCDIVGELGESMLDERAVQLAVINLIDNALKYASDGKVVRVRASREGSELIVRVIDRGPGVPKEDRERIFERFVRGNRAIAPTGAPVRGSGIGLSLVKHIAESHGGRAWVESSEGAGGSTFALSIPALAAGTSR
ncbi:MAG: HAMP domain-containing histidine kinase [Myxococcales bacterium]|nr:HAMP domain-containing histidine kinase [Myxococcales bacterium]